MEDTGKCTSQVRKEGECKSHWKLVIKMFINKGVPWECYD